MILSVSAGDNWCGWGNQMHIFMIYIFLTNPICHSKDGVGISTITFKEGCDLIRALSMRQSVAIYLPLKNLDHTIFIQFGMSYFFEGFCRWTCNRRLLAIYQSPKLLLSVWGNFLYYGTLYFSLGASFSEGGLLLISISIPSFVCVCQDHQSNHLHQRFEALGLEEVYSLRPDNLCRLNSNQ